MTAGDLRRAVVTGATSGIGAATVRAFASEGLDVLAVARRGDVLAELAAETGAEVLAADVRSADAHAAVAAFAPDVLVNNAGVGHGISGLETVGPETIATAFEVNVTAAATLVAAVLPGMRARRRGHVVTLGSISGLHTNVSAVYGATKAALHRFSQNLRYELRGSGLRVTEICPGRVSTGFYGAAEGDPQRIEAMGRSGIRELDPEDIAAAILYAISAPAHVNVATIEILPVEQAVGGVDATPRA
ncbi:MAG: SDR family oxidoreductase [Pseudomonadota bacterium]